MDRVFKEIPENISDFLGYSEDSPSGLIWKSKIPRSHKNAGDIAGYLGTDGRYCVKFNKVLYKAHRIVWYLHNGQIPDGFEIDHIDNNPANNKIDNLRISESCENSWNRTRIKHKESGLPKGISFYRAKGTKEGYMRATIYQKGKRLTKSSYILSELLSWLREKRQSLHGEFSNNG